MTFLQVFDTMFMFQIMPPSGMMAADVTSITVGILEVQGAFLEHRVALQNAARLLGNNVQLSITEIRTPEHITKEMDGLIIPGGESTTISIYLRRNELELPLKQWIEDERHVTWGTCAGMILLSKLTDNQKIGGQTSVSNIEIMLHKYMIIVFNHIEFFLVKDAFIAILISTVVCYLLTDRPTYPDNIQQKI